MPARSNLWCSTTPHRAMLDGGKAISHEIFGGFGCCVNLYVYIIHNLIIWLNLARIPHVHVLESSISTSINVAMSHWPSWDCCDWPIIHMSLLKLGQYTHLKIPILKDTSRRDVRPEPTKVSSCSTLCLTWLPWLLELFARFRLLCAVVQRPGRFYDVGRWAKLYLDVVLCEEALDTDASTKVQGCVAWPKPWGLLHC